MKMNTPLCLLGLIPLLVSCASQPITLGPVGPSPLAGSSSSPGIGHLEVFSGLVEQSDDQNQGSTDPIWYQHSDYKVYDTGGKLVQQVDNTVGHYSTSPRLVSLPAGSYTVRAQASGGVSVNIPVIIERDRTTKVHLDEKWRLSPTTPKTEVVCAPAGYPVGWRAHLAVK
jgi:hypothetical protein